MINWVGFESIQLKKSAIYGYVTDKMKRFHCTTSGHCVGFLWQKFRFWSKLTKRANQKLKVFALWVLRVGLEFKELSEYCVIHKLYRGELGTFRLERGDWFQEKGRYDWRIHVQDINQLPPKQKKLRLEENQKKLFLREIFSTTEVNMSNCVTLT